MSHTLTALSEACTHVGGGEGLVSEVTLYMHIEVQEPLHIHAQNSLGGQTLHSETFTA